ncbi:macrophage mannose receptor 1-like [Engraulis encrasicolus]|uniref:macrophage mannose receptor 1-like n=1 Tax=Engraulis encrasicolus TaxID=184585 RepID=UPI002FCF1017
MEEDWPLKFHVVKESLSWREARQTCREEFTDLATIYNMAEINEIKRVMQAADVGDGWRVWIGLRQGRWQWTLAANSRRITTGRNFTHPFVLVEDGKNWTEAQRNCREKHTDLSTIRNQAENDEIVGLLTGQEYHVWIGLFRDAWKWSDGSSSTFRHWVVGQTSHMEVVSPQPPFYYGEEVILRCDIPEYKGQHQYVWLKNNSPVSNQTNQTIIIIHPGHYQCHRDRSGSSVEPYMSKPVDIKYQDLPASTVEVVSPQSPFYSGDNVTLKCNAMNYTDWYQYVWFNKSSEVVDKTSQTIIITLPLEADKLVLVHQNKTWLDALQYCRQHHVDLVSVSSEKVQRWVEGWAKGASSPHVWLGLRYQCSFGFWFWVSGYSVCYDNWASDADRMPGCDIAGGAVGRDGGQWVSLQETQALNFICTDDECVSQVAYGENAIVLGKLGNILYSLAIIGMELCLARFCFEEQTVLDGKKNLINSLQFHKVVNKKTWKEAQQYCRKEFTDLATIDNMTEIDEIKSMIQDDHDMKPEDGVWIGLKWNGSSLKWQWSLADEGFNGENEAKFRNWDGEQPEGRAGEDWANSTHPYVLVEEKTNWTEAQEYCREKHTDLASVRNQTENANITGLLTGRKGHVWIGLFRDPWEWSDGSSSSFRHWDVGEPNYGDANRQFCTQVRKSGLWNDVGCHNDATFICYEDKLVLVHQNKTWMEALQYCRQHHVDLVSVSSEKIQRWVEGWAKGASSPHVFLGLRHSCTFGFWFWVNGDSVCYDNFASNEQRNPQCAGGNTPHVGSVRRDRGKWVSRPGTEKLNFICTDHECCCDCCPPGCSKCASGCVCKGRACDASCCHKQNAELTSSKKFYVVKANKTWTEAQQYCRARFTDLATIDNMAEVDKIKSMMIQDKDIGVGVWIGLKWNGSSQWQWSLADEGFYGENETKFWNWDIGQTDSRPGEDCGCIDQEGKWHNCTCTKRCGFICYNETNSTHPYVLFKEEKNWTEAQRYCREKHTDLASVRNQTENDEIKELVSSRPGNPTTGTTLFWIGLFRDAWEWSDGSNSTFRNWRAGEPNGGNTDQYCTQILNLKLDFGLWNDVGCHNNATFICEDKLVLVHQNKTWMDALQHCRQHHVDLVSVSSEKMQRWVEGWAKGASSPLVWLGLRHSCTFGFWFWVNGDSVCYDNFASNEQRNPQCAGGNTQQQHEASGAPQSKEAADTTHCKVFPDII